MSYTTKQIDDEAAHVESETPRTDDYLFMSPRASSQAWEELFLHAQTLERELTTMTKDRDEWKAKAEANERDACRMILAIDVGNSERNNYE